MILADTDISARVMNRTSLTNDDVTRLSERTTKQFHTKSFAV